MPVLDSLFCFYMPEEVSPTTNHHPVSTANLPQVFYEQSEKSTSEIPIIERDAKAVSAAASALAQIKELMSLPYEERTTLLNELQVLRLEESLTSAEIHASRAATMAGTPLYHHLLDAPEVMRNVLSHFERIDLVRFSLASKECARLAMYLAPAADRWTFKNEERSELFIYLKEEEGWFGGEDWCDECENMMMHSLDLGDLCDVCAEEYEADIRAHQRHPSSWEEDSEEEEEEKEEEEEEEEEKEE